MPLLIDADYLRNGMRYTHSLVTIKYQQGLSLALLKCVISNDLK